MCKLIKFKKEFFDIDRKSKDTKKTTIERDYTTLKFNFSDLTREEKKDLLITINEFLDKYITKGKNLSSEEKEEKKDKIYFNLLSIFTVKHILNELLPNSCILSKDKTYLILKRNGNQKTIKVHSLFIRNETLFGLYADRKFFRKGTDTNEKDKSVFNILGDKVGSDKEANIHFMIFYNTIFINTGSLKTFKGSYINEDINSEESRQEFYVIGFSYKNDIKEYGQEKEIINNVFHRKGQKDEQKDRQKGDLYNVAPIFKIRDFSEFIEIFCKEYRVSNPYENYGIEDFKIEKKYKDEVQKPKKGKNNYSYIEDDYCDDYYSYTDPIDIEFSKNYDVPDNPYDMSAEEYYWYLENHDPD